MRIRATPRLAQPFITSPARRTPSSYGRSPNGSSPSPTIRKTAIVASTQNAAVSCTLRRERKRTHGGLAPPCPNLCRCVGTSSYSLDACCVIASSSKPAPGNLPRSPSGFGGSSVEPSKRRRWLVHALGLEKAGDGDRATLQSGAVGFREGVLLFALDVNGPHDLPLHTLHHRYDDF